MWQQIYDKQRALGGREKRCGKNVKRDKKKSVKEMQGERGYRRKKEEKITKRGYVLKDRESKRVNERKKNTKYVLS